MRQRQEVWSQLQQSWDLIVIGGGITGAGVFAEASRRGLRCLLLEQRDYASGTSSRSGKLVHGGLRYLKQGQIKLTLQSVREREHLLARYPGMVERLPFLMPLASASVSSRITLKTGLSLYDLMAGRRTHHFRTAEQVLREVPGMESVSCFGGYQFEDAKTDDARLVLRVIEEGQQHGGSSVNYAKVTELMRDRQGQVLGVTVCDEWSGQYAEIKSSLVINCTGIWTDQPPFAVQNGPPLRKLRGSHLLLQQHRLPLQGAVSFFHPRDSRPVYAYPWEGAILFGTTDIEHTQSLDTEPHMTGVEGTYLFEALTAQFPHAKLGVEDVLSVYSGVRSVIDTGKENPSEESREHAIWADAGFVSVTGGKLTTYRQLAVAVLHAAKLWLRGSYGVARKSNSNVQEIKIPPLEKIDGHGQLQSVHRLMQRYEDDVVREIWGNTSLEAQESLAGTGISLAELMYAARSEQVVHLDDLLWRRTRLGLIVHEGGVGLLPELKQPIASMLGWGEEMWTAEVTRYQNLWQSAYSPRLLSVQSHEKG